MLRRIREKLHSRRGLNVLVALLGLLTAVLLAIAAVPPVYRAYKTRADERDCYIALQKAQEAADIVAIQSGGTVTDEAARRAVEQCMWTEGALCPAGGDFYIARDEHGNPLVVCGVHDTDLKRRTRLNAEAALDKLEAELARAGTLGEAEPERVELRLNGETLPALRVTEEPPIRRGTATTSGYEGTVIFYQTSRGGVSFLAYADSDYCALWHAASKSWSGDAWE